SASASFVRWWTRTTQPPPVRRASSGCTRKTVGDNHGMGELSSQRLSVPSCDRTSVTGSGRLQGFFGTQTPLQWYLWSVTAPPSGVGGLLPAQGLVRVTYVDLVSWRPSGTGRRNPLDAEGPGDHRRFGHRPRRGQALPCACSSRHRPSGRGRSFHVRSGRGGRGLRQRRARTQLTPLSTFSGNTRVRCHRAPRPWFVGRRSIRGPRVALRTPAGAVGGEEVPIPVVTVLGMTGQTFVVHTYQAEAAIVTEGPFEVVQE